MSQEGGLKRKLAVVIKVFVDIVFLILAFLPVVVLARKAQPFKRGFYCDDESIRKPYKPYSEDFVTPSLLAGLAFGLPLIIVVLNELLSHFFIKKPVEDQDDDRSSASTIIAAIYKYIGAFNFGTACTMTTTFVIKYMVGRLRPYFLTICNPDLGNFTCYDNQGLPRYIEDDVCAGSAADMKQARQSFPSGHASSAMFTAVYLAIYLYMRFHFRYCHLLRPLLQLVLLNMGVVCCVSRVSDYKHHASDVIAGGLIGSLIALITGYSVCDIFATSKFHEILKRLCLLKSAKYDPFQALSTTDPDEKLDLIEDQNAIAMESPAK